MGITERTGLEIGGSTDILRHISALAPRGDPGSAENQGMLIWPGNALGGTTHQ